MSKKSHFKIYDLSGGSMSLDHSKMGKRNFVKWGDTGDYTAILSDKELDIDWRTKIARNGGKLILC